MMVSCAGVLPVFLLIVAISGCRQEYASDEFFIRGHLNIPTDVPMSFFRASPEGSSSLFGRENLLIKAKFKFKDQKQFDDFLTRAQVVQNWNPLPVPEKIYMKVEECDRYDQADLIQIDQIKDGYWFCETTQGNGFFAPTATFYRCPPADLDKDFFLAAIDKEALEMTVVLKQDYSLK